jgi:hypothetical protein
LLRSKKNLEAKKSLEWCIIYTLTDIVVSWWAKNCLLKVWQQCANVIKMERWKMSKNKRTCTYFVNECITMIIIIDFMQTWHHNLTESILRFGAVATRPSQESKIQVRIPPGRKVLGKTLQRKEVLWKIDLKRYAFIPGLPDFSCYNIPKRGKIYITITMRIKLQRTALHCIKP